MSIWRTETLAQIFNQKFFVTSEEEYFINQFWADSPECPTSVMMQVSGRIYMMKVILIWRMQWKDNDDIKLSNNMHSVNSIHSAKKPSTISSVRTIFMFI